MVLARGRTMMLVRGGVLSVFLGKAAAAHSPRGPGSDSTSSPRPEVFSRRLGDDDADADADDISWMQDYAVKFEGCSQAENVALFRLCPANKQCSNSCEGPVYAYKGLNLFADSFTEAQMNAREYRCEMMRENCDGDDDGCYATYGNAYDGCDDEDDFNVQEYLECQQYDDDYYIGPYCMDDENGGTSIYLRVFTDDECSVLAEDEAQDIGDDYDITSPIIDPDDCPQCNEHAKDEDENDGDQEDDDDVLEQCEDLHAYSNACEENLDIDNPDLSACDYVYTLEAQISSASSAGQSTRNSSGASRAGRAIFGTLVALLACVALFLGYRFYAARRKAANKQDLSSQGHGAMM